jgi:RNA polymerase sigma-70 factor (ECF subfamily)
MTPTLADMETEARDAAAEARLLESAVKGDRGAFEELVELSRADTLAHCYRMLGSLHDAEDALQDALVRAWKALPRFESRSAFSTWLYRIATNVCLDMLRRKSKRVLPIDFGPAAEGGAAGAEPGSPVAAIRALPDETWIEPFPSASLGLADGPVSPTATIERKEAVELAFIAALQHLTPKQRAALILREVLGFSAKEVAETLEASPASVEAALQRARRTIVERAPEQSQQRALSELGDEGVRKLVTRFTTAFETGDIDAILDLLAEDATFQMPPYPEWSDGRDAVGDSWLMPGGDPPRLRYAETRVNGQLALGTYLIDDARTVYRPIGLDVITVGVDGRIADVTVFRGVEDYEALGLPASIAA